MTAASLKQRSVPAHYRDSRNHDGNESEHMRRLSPRENEVASLISEGLSDKQIASRLAISRRTAESHVAHILAKLGFSSRVQLAVYIATEPSTP